MGFGRPSIPPERLLRATLLQLLYSIRSERRLVERIEFDLLFRWFVGLSIDEKVFDASTFSKNRDRLLTQEIAQGFLSSLLALPEVKGLLSAEHFSVDGTLLKAWASMKSFRPKSLSSGEDPRNGSGEPPSPGRNGEADFRKTKRTNETHASTTDKGRAAVPQSGRTGEPSLLSRPCADGEPQRACGRGRSDFGDGNRGTGGCGALSANGRPKARRSGPTRTTTPKPSSKGLKARRIEPHVAINGTVSKKGKVGKTAVPDDVAASLGYAISQRLRKRIEASFGWSKMVGGLAQLKVRGLDKARAVFVFAMAAYNIVRLPKLLAATGEVCPAT